MSFASLFSAFTVKERQNQIRDIKKTITLISETIPKTNSRKEIDFLLNNIKDCEEVQKKLRQEQQKIINKRINNEIIKKISTINFFDSNLKLNIEQLSKKIIPTKEELIEYKKILEENREEENEIKIISNLIDFIIILENKINPLFLNKSQNTEKEIKVISLFKEEDWKEENSYKESINTFLDNIEKHFNKNNTQNLIYKIILK